MQNGYDYNRVCEDIEKLCREYAFAESFCIGESVMKRPIYCIKIGTGAKKLFLNGAHHGLEYLTAAMLMKFAYEYSGAIQSGGELLFYNAKKLFERTTLYIVPMVNPDGCDLVVNGIHLDNKYHMELVRQVGLLPFDRVWQANIRGVDINHNYNAHWQSVELSPSATRYSGPYPESEPETQAMVNLTYGIEFDMAIAFHSQGGEIYYEFNGLTAPDSYYFADKFASVSGYTPEIPEGAASFGGYKDWFIQEFAKPGFTVEIGRGQNPLEMSLLAGVYKENLPIILCALAEC